MSGVFVGAKNRAAHDTADAPRAVSIVGDSEPTDEVGGNPAWIVGAIRLACEGG